MNLKQRFKTLLLIDISIFSLSLLNVSVCIQIDIYVYVYLCRKSICTNFSLDVSADTHTEKKKKMNNSLRHSNKWMFVF